MSRAARRPHALGRASLGDLDQPPALESLRLRCTCGRRYVTTLDLLRCRHGEATGSAAVAPAAQPRTPREQAITAGLIVPANDADADADPEDA